MIKGNGQNLALISFNKGCKHVHGAERCVWVQCEDTHEARNSTKAGVPFFHWRAPGTIRRFKRFFSPYGRGARIEHRFYDQEGVEPMRINVIVKGSDMHIIRSPRVAFVWVWKGGEYDNLLVQVDAQHVHAAKGDLTWVSRLHTHELMRAAAFRPITDKTRGTFETRIDICGRAHRSRSDSLDVAVDDREMDPANKEEPWFRRKMEEVEGDAHRWRSNSMEVAVDDWEFDPANKQTPYLKKRRREEDNTTEGSLDTCA